MMMRKLLTGLACSALVAGFVALLTGAVALVETSGNSMAPRIHEGDLVIVHASSSYRVGDVVAYHSTDLGQTVLHRVSAINGDRYTLRGDHNDFDDAEHPTRDQLRGKELARIPAGGIWLDRLVHPAVLGVLTFGLLATGGTAINITTRHRRKNRRKSRAMSQHAASARTSSWAAIWAPWLRTTVTISVILSATGLLLGAVSWTQPTTEPTTTAVPNDRTMKFSYHAEVPPSPAYDTNRVTAPTPIFRSLTNTVDLHYTYRGDPGTITVAAELSTASGWHSRIPLQKPLTFHDRDHTGTIPLHLKALEARAQAASKTIGIPTDHIDLTVVPTITTTNGEVFAPQLTLALTPTQLTLTGGTPALTVTDTTTTDHTTHTANTLGINGHHAPITTLRTASGALLSTGLLTLALASLLARRKRTTTNEATAIKRRYPTILLDVEPVTSPPGRPLIDVTDFPALAKLADRYGLCVMHWTRAGTETFIVHDDTTTYRYRTTTTTHSTPIRT